MTDYEAWECRMQDAGQAAIKAIEAYVAAAKAYWQTRAEGNENGWYNDPIEEAVYEQFNAVVPVLFKGALGDAGGDPQNIRRALMSVSQDILLWCGELEKDKMNLS